MAVGIVFCWFCHQIPDIVPHGFVPQSPLGEIEFPRSIGRARGKAVPHGGLTPVSLKTYYILYWAGFWKEKKEKAFTFSVAPFCKVYSTSCLGMSMYWCTDLIRPEISLAFSCRRSSCKIIVVSINQNKFDYSKFEIVRVILKNTKIIFVTFTLLV